RYRKHLGMIILPPIDPKVVGVAEACRQLEAVIRETYEARRDEFGGDAKDGNTVLRELSFVPSGAQGEGAPEGDGGDGGATSGEVG
ncbi:hypothetical protein PPSIR1_17910, partial [Plesiocystis pacifica SIR-1]